MPSVKNPNTLSRNRQIARRAKSRKLALKHQSDARLSTRVEKADTRRGARAGILPTSGPNAPLSKKKQHKLEKQMAHAIRRKAEAEAAKQAEIQNAEDAAKARKELKQERNAAIDALGKMDIS